MLSSLLLILELHHRHPKMFQAAPSPGRSGPQSSSYGFATPVRTPSTSYTSNAAAYSQALTPVDASSSKAVRFQNQPLPPQVQQSQQPQQSALNSTATPNRSPYYNAVSAPTPAQTQSQNRSAVTTTSASAPPSASKITGARPTVASAAAGAIGAESAIALSRRIKWNLGALGLLWIVPALSTRPRDVYWTVLDQIYLHVGGETDELVDGVVGWILWAISVILLFNTVEAAVLMRRASAPQPPPQQIQAAAPAANNDSQKKSGLVLGMHSPQVAKSINFVAASRLKGSPKTRTSNIGAGSPISRSSPQGRASPSQGSPTTQPVDYSQFSPALRRTSSPLPSPSSGGGGGFSSTSRMGTPTQDTSAYGTSIGIGVSGASSSPLAAFRARHASRGSVSPSSIRAISITPSVSGGLAETSLSFDDGVDEVDAGESFLGDESFEVDRALRNLRNSLGGVSSTPAPSFR